MPKFLPSMMDKLRTPWLVLVGEPLLVSFLFLSAPGLEEGKRRVLLFRGGVKEELASDVGTAKRFRLRTIEGHNCDISSFANVNFCRFINVALSSSAHFIISASVEGILMP